MSEPLRVVLLEDNADDAELVARELRKSVWPIDVCHVDTRPEFVQAITEFDPQLILSDHRLAEFTGMEALGEALSRAPEVPFIFVTGSLNEETAVECIKAGAWDYVVKDRLVRLGPAVQGALELKRTRDALDASQAQIRLMQKMEAIGRLAAGMAHDFSSLMTTVLGYSEILQKSFDPGDPRAGDLAEITRVSLRGRELVNRLLAISRGRDIPLQPLHLNDVVTNTERLLRPLLGDGVRVVTWLEPKLHRVRANASQLEQALVNLVMNARDAMSGGGRVTIQTANVALDEDHSAKHPQARPGEHVMLAVSDTGAGMSPQALAHLYEPFFTTKGPGHGTGLGLSAVYGAVRQSGGHISVESVPKQGTVFRIYFPRVAESEP